MPRDCSEEQRIWIFINPPRQREGFGGVCAVWWISRCLQTWCHSQGFSHLDHGARLSSLYRHSNRNLKELCCFWIWAEVPSGRSVLPSIWNVWGYPDSQWALGSSHELETNVVLPWIIQPFPQIHPVPPLVHSQWHALKFCFPLVWHTWSLNKPFLTIMENCLPW